MLPQNKRTPKNRLHLSERALNLYFSLFERFIAAGKPTTLYLTTGQLAEVTGLACWEVCLGRIELVLAGCLHPVNFSPYSIRNVYRFTCIDMKDYAFEEWNSITEIPPTASIEAAGV